MSTTVVRYRSGHWNYLARVEMRLVLSPKRPRLPFSPSRIPDYDDIGQTLATTFRTVLAEAESVAFVTHSQGGLVLQRFLAWMVREGDGRELARVASVVMLACPNDGSDYLRTLRNTVGLRRPPQAGKPNGYDRKIADTRRVVLARIANATGIDDHHCPTPFHVYAGNADQVWSPSSAKSAFPGA